MSASAVVEHHCWLVRARMTQKIVVRPLFWRLLNYPGRRGWLSAGATKCYVIRDSTTMWWLRVCCGFFSHKQGTIIIFTTPDNEIISCTTVLLKMWQWLSYLWWKNWNRKSYIKNCSTFPTMTLFDITGCLMKLQDKFFCQNYIRASTH